MIPQPLPYSPSIGHALRLFSQAENRSVWLRHGSSKQETFAAFPASWTSSTKTFNDCVNSGLGSNSKSNANGYSTGNADTLRDLNSLLGKLPASSDTALAALPFRGGLLGFSAYDSQPLDSSSFPALYVGLYPHFIHIDHARQTACAYMLPGFPDATAEWQAWLTDCEAQGIFSTPPLHQKHFSLTAPFSALTSAERYRHDFQRIHDYLLAGDCYQVNYAQAFKAKCEGHSAFAMQQLLTVSNPAWAAWVSIPEGDVLSLSPELFLKVENKKILASPIKGTAPRLNDPVADKQQADTLQKSTKNRAENLMIVDLLRNDMSQHAVTGSVKAEQLFTIESLPQVHHLVSHITATLRDDSSVLALIRDCFPGGSITGAPKKRAIEIIQELEPTPRSIYCGSIGFINADGDACFNIAIRTLLRLGDDLYAWAGGGIVADSECESEYQECFHKIGALMTALEDM